MERRQDILIAARAVFEAKGYAEATVDEIAARAGVSKGSIYNYFASKSDILRNVLADALESGRAEVDDLARAELPAAEKLQRLLDYVFEGMNASSHSNGIVIELWAAAVRQAELADAVARIHSHWRGHIREIVERGVRDGEFGSHIDPVDVSSLILAAINGGLVQSVFDRDTGVGEHSLSSLKRGLLASLRPGMG